MKASIKLFLVFVLLQLLGSLAAVPLVLVWQFVTTGTVDAEAADHATLVPGSLLALFFTVWYLWKKRYLDDHRQYAPTSAGYLTWTVLLLLGAYVVMEWVMGLLSFLPDWMGDAFDQMRGQWGGILFISLLGPIVEELLFRGAITRELLRRYRPGAAIVLSALLFGLAHFNPVQMVFAFVLGLLLGWMYWRTRSLVPCIVFHVLNNGLSTWLSLRYPDVENLRELWGTDVHTAVLAGAFAVFLLALWQLSRYPATGDAGWLPSSKEKRNDKTMD